MRSKILATLVSVVFVLVGVSACKATVNRGRFGGKNYPTTAVVVTGVPQSAASFVDYQGCRSNTDTGGVFNPPCVLDLKDGTYLLEFEDGHGTYYRLCADKNDKVCVRKVGSRYVVVS